MRSPYDDTRDEMGLIGVAASPAGSTPLGGGHDGAGDDVAPRTTRLVIIEPRQFIRDCLVQCLSTPARDYEVAAYASLAEWRDKDVDRGPVEIVLLRYASSKQYRRELAELQPLMSGAGRTASMVLISDDDDADEIVAAINDGARGFIPTNVSLKVAIEAMRLVKAGGVYVPASSLLNRRSFGSAESQNGDAASLFTPRQVAVLGEIRKGKANKIIAYDLKMKESTVKVHVRNIMRKVGATNRTEVAIKALELGREALC